MDQQSPRKQRSPSRVVPPAIKKILEVDKVVTEKFVLWTNKLLPLRSLRLHYKSLELTCHFIPWFAFWLAFSWLFNKPSLIQLQINILFALILDLVLVALSKAYFRRKRPSANIQDAIAEYGPDVYSFPSGHASRAVLVCYIFTNIYPLSIIFVPPMLAWVTSLCLTRIMMNRHYILDVVGGIVLGLMEGLLLSWLWISEDTAKWIMYSLTDEKLEGGDFHV